MTKGRKKAMSVALALPIAVGLLLAPIRVDVDARRITSNEACARYGCTAAPGMDCWADPNQTEPLHGYCDTRDCPSSWPPREE